MMVAALSGYTFSLVGRMSLDNGAKTMGEVWEREIGRQSSWIIDSSTFVFTMGCCLTFSIVLGDFLSSLAQSVGATGWLATRQTSILGVTLSALYPLSLMESLESLAPMSIAGVVGLVGTAIYMIAMCFTSHYKLPYGQFLSSVPLLPSFGTRKGFNPLSSLILGSMLANAFLAHYSAPDFIRSLKQNDKVVDKFKTLTAVGFGMTSIINTIVMVTGFLTFGGNTVGVILNNYSTQDLGASICRVLSSISILGAFPLLLRPGQTALNNLLFKDKEPSKSTNRGITTILVAMLTGGAMVMKNAGLIVSFNGALMGSAIIYIFPSMMFLANEERGTKVERLVNRGLIMFGVGAAIMGVLVSLLSVYAPHILAG